MINKYIEEAYKILDGKEISKELAFNLAEIEGEDIMDIVSLANKVKNKFAKDTHICSISNIKSGKCKENCMYCAQSAHYKTVVDEYGLVNSDKIIKEAAIAVENGVKHFGLVSSGKGYNGNSKELQDVLKLIQSLKVNYPQLDICLALGILDKKAAKIVSNAGIYHYNHNLQVDPSSYESLVSTTHSIDERINTIKNLRELGVNVCSGGIFGLGESNKDRVELGFAIKELDVSVIPINILVPIEGTPAYDRERISIYDALKSTAIFRLIHPTKTIKLAAGRETILKDFQGLFMLAGINGMLTGGYLTTRGRETKEDFKMLKELNLL